MTDEEKKQYLAEHVEEFANGFYGYGSWQNPNWAIGLEEAGCPKNAKGLNEAVRRLNTWQKLKNDGVVKNGLVDLNAFLNCFLKKPDSEKELAYKNKTWSGLRTTIQTVGEGF